MPPSDRDRQAYSDGYKECVATIRNSCDSYDKNLITISSAFLALPVALIRQASTSKPLMHPRVFLVSALFFIMTIISVLLSYQLGNKVQRCRLVDLKEYYLDGLDEAFNRRSRWSSALATVNGISGVLFLFGVLSAVYFIYNNVGSFQ